MEERFLGRQQELILLETVPQLQQKKAVLKFSIKIVVLQVVQLALKPMVRGQLLETVFKENVLGQGVGLQYKPILILVVTVLLQK